MKKLRHLIANETDLELVVRIERSTLLSGANGQNYLILNLVDDSGRLEARRWQVTEADKANLVANQYLLLTKAVTNEYRGQLQLKVNEYQILSSNELGSFGLKQEDFYVKAPIDIQKHYSDLRKLLSEFHNEVYRDITLNLLDKYETKFLTYPAAISIHHNVYGGLFWHSYTLVKNILGIQKNYTYAEIDWELLVAGAILHDLGKVIELNSLEATDYSLEGKLLGHISVGNSQIATMAQKLGIVDYAKGKFNPDVTKLEHLVLASHGKHEFGSPIEPHLLEAIILSSFDAMDARIYRVNEELKKVSNLGWTGKIPSEDGKMYYRHHGDKK